MRVGQERPWVAYVGPFSYPSGGAAARRVAGVSESLALCGYDVVIASGGDGAEGGLVPEREGVAYCLLGERVAEHWPQAARRFRYAWMGGKTVAWLSSQRVPPTAVILYSGYTPYLMRLLPWCRRNNIRLFFDAVEWYEPTRATGYVTSPYQWNIEWAMRRLVPRTDGVIAISSYLADYYQQRGLRTAIVPPTTSRIVASEWQPDATLRLCYAGNPGKNKDNLVSVLDAVARLSSQGAPVELAIAGLNLAGIQALSGMRGEPPEWLRVKGTLDYEAVQVLVGSSDFSILVRPVRRVSRAGFPTKFVESFAAGTPVIANLTSDLNRHLVNGETGIVLDSDDSKCVQAGLERAMALDRSALRQMRKSCIEHALDSFSPAAYVSTLQSLIGHPTPDAKESRCAH